MAVRRDRAGAGQRRFDGPYVLHPGEAVRDVLDGGLELGILEGELVALDEHDLLDRAQAGAIQRHLGSVRLTRELIDVGDVRRADHVAGREDDQDEGQPTPKRLLAMPAAPVRHAGREVVLRGRGRHARLLTLAFGADRCGSRRAPTEDWSRWLAPPRALKRSKFDHTPNGPEAPNALTEGAPGG